MISAKTIQNAKLFAYEEAIKIIDLTKKPAFSQSRHARWKLLVLGGPMSSLKIPSYAPLLYVNYIWIVDWSQIYGTFCKLFFTRLFTKVCEDIWRVNQFRITLSWFTTDIIWFLTIKLSVWKMFKSMCAIVILWTYIYPLR